MMEINNLTIIKKKDNRTLIDNFNFILHKGDKVAIIGEEGNGKSTLIKAIYDRSLIEEYCNVKGTINTNNYKVGYLKQSLDEDSVNDEVMNFFLKDSVTGEIDFDMYNNIEKIDASTINYGINGLETVQDALNTLLSPILEIKFFSTNISTFMEKGIRVNFCNLTWGYSKDTITTQSLRVDGQ